MEWWRNLSSKLPRDTVKTTPDCNLYVVIASDRYHQIIFRRDLSTLVGHLNIFKWILCLHHIYPQLPHPDDYQMAIFSGAWKKWRFYSISPCGSFWKPTGKDMPCEKQIEQICLRRQRRCKALRAYRCLNIQRNTNVQLRCDVRLLRFQNWRWMDLYSTEQALFPDDVLFCFQHQAQSVFCQYNVSVSEDKYILKSWVGFFF